MKQGSRRYPYAADVVPAGYSFGPRTYVYVQWHSLRAHGCNTSVDMQMYELMSKAHNILVHSDFCLLTLEASPTQVSSATAGRMTAAAGRQT